jgi:SAM-dependent methyltransferase
MYTDTVGCRACNSSNRVEILSFGDMPLSNGLLSEVQTRHPESRFPLTVLFCPACSLVQIRETVDPAVLFSADYPYFSSVSDAWVQHCQANALELIETRRLGPDSLVVEIASNDGYLLRNYVKAGVPVLGIDPAAGPAAAAREAGVPTREAFFGRGYADALAEEGIHADVVHANNVLAHVADLPGFVAGVGRLLKEGGVAVIEVPYVRDMIDHCEFDTIYHEHMSYFSVTAVTRLLAQHGLILTDVRRLPTHGGSLRLYVEKSGAPSAKVNQLLDEERSLGLVQFAYYRDFADRVASVRLRLTQLLASLRSSGKRIAGYSVSAKGTILLNSAGIDGRLIDYLVDRSPHKQGKYMPGVHLPVYDTAKLLEEPVPDYLLLLAWNFKDEIMRQQQEYVSRGGRFIVPIPEPAIVPSPVLSAAGVF